MALDKTDFDPTASGSKGSAPRLASYYTTDNMSVVETDGYFDGIADQLRDKDFILCKMGDGSRIYTINYTAPSDIALVQELIFANIS